MNLSDLLMRDADEAFREKVKQREMLGDLLGNLEVVKMASVMSEMGMTRDADVLHEVSRPGGLMDRIFDSPEDQILEEAFLGEQRRLTTFFKQAAPKPTLADPRQAKVTPGKVAWTEPSEIRAKLPPPPIRGWGKFFRGGQSQQAAPKPTLADPEQAEATPSRVTWTKPSEIRASASATAPRPRRLRPLPKEPQPVAAAPVTAPSRQAFDKPAPLHGPTDKPTKIPKTGSAFRYWKEKYAQLGWLVKLVASTGKSGAVPLGKVVREGKKVLGIRASAAVQAAGAPKMIDIRELGNLLGPKAVDYSGGVARVSQKAIVGKMPSGKITPMKATGAESPAAGPAAPKAPAVPSGPPSSAVSGKPPVLGPAPAPIAGPAPAPAPAPGSKPEIKWPKSLDEAKRLIQAYPTESAVATGGAGMLGGMMIG